MNDEEREALDAELRKRFETMSDAEVLSEGRKYSNVVKRSFASMSGILCFVRGRLVGELAVAEEIRARVAVLPGQDAQEIAKGVAAAIDAASLRRRTPLETILARAPRGDSGEAIAEWVAEAERGDTSAERIGEAIEEAFARMSQVDRSLEPAIELLMRSRD